MGAKLTKVVFQVPDPPAYVDCDGTMSYIRRNGPDKRPKMDSTPLIWIKTSTGSQIPLIFLQPRENPNPTYTWLVSHGTAEDLGLVIRYAAELCDALGVNVCCYDYTGYGISEGTPTEEQTYADIQAVFEWLTDVKKIEHGKIIVFGRSLGSGPSIDLASKKVTGGVVLVSPFLSCLRVVLKTVGAPPSAGKDMYMNIDKIKKMQTPLMVLHGKQDKLVPIKHSQELFRRAPCKVRAIWFEHADHNNVESCNKELVWLRYAAFMEDAMTTNSGVEIQVQEEIVTEKDAENRKAAPKYMLAESLWWKLPPTSLGQDLNQSSSLSLNESECMSSSIL